MSIEFQVIAIVALCAGGFFVLWCLWQRRLDAAWEERHPRSAFKYCGKTLLFYDDFHGNQVEYLEPNGYCYLWYSGNPVILVGRWRSDKALIYFRYGINTYNPATGIIGGNWEPSAVDLWSTTIVDAVPGDELELKKRLPFVLTKHPAIRSIRELSTSGHD